MKKLLLFVMAVVVASEYCRAIAHIIVTQGSDYVPDGTIDGENKQH